MGKASLQPLENSKCLFSGNYDFFCMNFKEPFASALRNFVKFLVNFSDQSTMLILNTEEVISH